MQTCTIGMSMDADIKMRSRRRWKKGHVYIHSAKSVSEPLTRLPCPCNAVISVFRYGTVTEVMPSCSYYIKKGLVYITIVAPFSCQPLSYAEYIKVNIYL